MGPERKKTYGFLLAVALSMVLLSSCSVEKKLGKEFNETRSDSLVLVLSPDYLFKNNLKTYLVPGLDTLPEYVQDSLLLDNSLFLKQLSDTGILNEFNRNFVERLKEYHFTVLEEPALDSFMTAGSTGLLVNIAQISMEEFVYPYSFDYNLVDESLTVDSIDLNAISMNIWIEVSHLNAVKKNKVFFASEFITDDLEGYFRQYIFSSEIQFEYSIDTITLQDIDSLSISMGKRCASYLYDFFLNLYIREHAPANLPYELRPLHWNPRRQAFEFVDPDNQFIELRNAGE